jgi:hypothetical protein
MREVLVSAVLGVHGIGRHSEGSADATLAVWTRAFRIGVEKTDYTGEPPALSLAYYRSIFAASRRRPGPKGLGPADDDPVNEAEAQFLAELGDEVFAQLAEPERRAVESPSPPLGASLPPVEPAVLRSVRAFEARWGRGAGALLLGRVRQVHAYLSDARVAGMIRAAVAAEIDLKTQVLLGHSLGSVVAYDLLRCGVEGPSSITPGVRTLVTFGSPLAWSAVRRRLEGPSPGSFSVPRGITWVNVHDPRDAVTAGAPLGPLASGIVDHPVDNGSRDAHGARRYLRHKELARAVLDGLRPADRPQR